METIEIEYPKRHKELEGDDILIELEGGKNEN